MVEKFSIPSGMTGNGTCVVKRDTDVAEATGAVKAPGIGLVQLHGQA